MAKYRPALKWSEDYRNLRAVCGMCDWCQTDTSVAAARAHVLAHPTHIVATVATVTTLLSVAADTDEVTETPLTQGRREADRVPR